jgi:uncharacterized protein
MTPDLTVTAPYAAALAIVFLVLSVRVIVLRRARAIGFGSTDNPELERRVRVHANFAEYTPFALLLLAMAELRGAPALWLHIGCALLLAGRLVHAIGLARPATDTLGRILGMTGSQTAILIGAGLLVLG